MKNDISGQIAMKVSCISILTNLLLSAFKLIAGITANSNAMVSDAVHSASDVFSTIIVIIGMKIAAKAPDREHPYGHERFECITALLLSSILALTGGGIGLAGIRNIFDSCTVLQAPGKLAMFAAILSVLVKEWQYWFTRAAALKINSGALLADAWHHRSDSLSSLGAFAGILGARIGFPILDPIAGIVICFLILKTAYAIFTDAVGKLVDKSCTEQTVAKMVQVITSTEKVAALDSIRTRIFGSKIYVDIEIAVDGKLPLSEAHRIAEQVHDTVENNFPLVKHCMVHANPADEED